MKLLRFIVMLAVIGYAGWLAWPFISPFLEGAGPDVPLSPQDPAQVHIVSDRPGLMMRRKLGEIFERHDRPSDSASAA